MSLRGVLPSPPRGEKQQSGWEGREGGREEGQALPETGGEEDGHGASAPFPELPLLSLSAASWPFLGEPGHVNPICGSTRPVSSLMAGL